MSNNILNPFKNQKHNHNACIKNALQSADKTCSKLGLRLTKTRRFVLELIWNSHSPMKAYEILEILHQENPKAAPATVYRALEFLQEARLVHRIESLNAFIGCGDPSHPHIGQFLICHACGAVAEMNDPNITCALNQEAKEMGFATQQQIVEIKGLCPQCQ